MEAPSKAQPPGTPGDTVPESSRGAPRKRSDVAEKLQRRRTESEAVVKAALLKHLRGAASKAQLRSAIQDRVAAYSKRMHLASTALSGLVKQRFANAQEAIALVALPDFSQTFFHQLLLGVEGAHLPDPFVQAYYQAHPALLARLSAQPRHLGDSNIYSAGAKLYQTNFRNACVVNFRRRLNKYLHAFQARHRLSDDQRVWMLYAIHGWDVRPLSCAAPTPVMAWAMVQQRHILGLEGTAEVTPAWLDAAPTLPRLVRHAVHLCRYLEEAGHPAFDLVPIARRGAHFVTIDTSVLYGLMKEVKLVDCNFATFDSLRDEQWRSVLKLDGLLGAQRQAPAGHAAVPGAAAKVRRFTGTIQTDGVSICVHFTLPRTSQAEPPVAKASRQAAGPLAARSAELTVLGLDPGRANIYCFALPRGNGKKAKTWKLTRGHYYSASGMLQARQQSEAWQRGVQAELATLSLVSTKGTSVSAHDGFLQANLDTFDALWQEYLKPRWARQCLRLYAGKQRTLATFLNKVAEEAKQEGGGKPVAVAYGAAKFAPGGKGQVSVPTTRAYQECAARLETVLVEFRTTRTSALDGSLLKAVHSRQAGCAVRGLLWYESTSVSKFVDRDLNAALNIRRCAVLAQRPAELCRLAGQAALGRMAVGKKIKC